MAKYIIFLLVLLSSSCNYVEEYFPSRADKSKNIVELYVEDQSKISAGIYDQAIVAISDSQLTAIYYSSEKQNDCYFYLQGILNDDIDTVPIQWRSAKNDLIGKGLIIISENKNLRLKFEAEQFNTCSRELFVNGVELYLLKKYNWRSLRLIKGKSVSVFEEPLEDMPSIGKMSNKELVCVLEEKANWLRVENRKSKITLGWIQKTASEELFPSDSTRD